MELEDCLPAALRGPSTTITRVAAGLSGAGVYRVEAEGRAYVLKVGTGSDPVELWRRRLDVQSAAASAGVAPAIIHTDEAHRAVVTEHVVDRGLPMWFGNPATREAALTELGRTLRRLHDLPVPAGSPRSDPSGFLEKVWTWVKDMTIPPFVSEAVERVRRAPVPEAGRPDVMSHNDVNPSNIVFDGQRLLLLDWDTSAPNDAYYDLATIALFLRMDAATSMALLGAHDGTPVSTLPERFLYDRKLIGALCGSLFLHLARSLGHTGSASDDSAGLAEVYQRMRAGTLDLKDAAGRWHVGLALLKESLGAT